MEIVSAPTSTSSNHYVSDSGTMYVVAVPGLAMTNEPIAGCAGRSNCSEYQVILSWSEEPNED